MHGWLTIFTVYILITIPAEAKRSVNSLPNDVHFSTLSRHEDCSVYRALQRKFKSALEQNELALRQEQIASNKRREQLSACAAKKGLSLRQEDAVAEACPELFEMWVGYGYRSRMVQEEVAQNRESLRDTEILLESYCRNGGQNRSSSLQIRNVVP